MATQLNGWLSDYNPQVSTSALPLGLLSTVIKPEDNDDNDGDDDDDDDGVHEPLNAMNAGADDDGAVLRRLHARYLFICTQGALFSCDFAKR